MKEKIVGIMVCMLVLATAFPASQAVQVNKKETPLSSIGSKGVEWSKTYGGSEFDEFRDVEQTTDGGYIACGETTHSGIIYPWVVKTDAAGNQVWNWTLTQFYYNQAYYDIINDYSNCIKQVNDGGYVVCLQLNFMLNSEEMGLGGLAKLNATGAEQWVQIYAEGFSWSFWPSSLIITDDGYLLAGCSGAIPTADTDVAVTILKTNTNGVEQWHQAWQYGPYADQAWAVCKTTDNGYGIAGYYNDSSTTIAHSFLIKTDSNGNQQWNKTYGGKSWDFLQSRNCYQTPDGGYIMGGYTYSYGAGGEDAWIVKMDSAGTMLWNKTFGDKRNDNSFEFEKTTDGGYIIERTNNFSWGGGDKEDIFLIKIDGNGNTKWVQKFGGPGIQMGTGVSTTNDGGFIVSGRTGEYQTAASDAMLVKFAPINITVTIKGGFGITAEIKNTGIANLTNVSWSFEVKGGILKHINKTISGMINIHAGETITLGTLKVFGFGALSITAKVADEEKTAKGTQIIIYSMVKK